MKTILVTGGLGYIGSHFIASLNHKKYKVICIDNLCNSEINVFHNLKLISKVEIIFYKFNLFNKNLLERIFKINNISLVVHFSGLKSVEDSFNYKNQYYKNNVLGSKILFEAMEKFSVNKIIFSSSATVYGQPEYYPIDELHPLQAKSPYAENKIEIENILKNIALHDNKWSIGILRYFNPIGSHKSFLIGDNPSSQPTNIMPILNIAAFHNKKFNILGNDYPTNDGTCIRDYIHIMDLARGHILLMEKILKNNFLTIINLGTGKGTSVLELVDTYNNINNVKIEKFFKKRRTGDVHSVFASNKKAFEILGWKPIYDLQEMCKSSYEFYKKFYLSRGPIS